MDDPDTVEVDQHVEPRTALVVCLEEDLLPNDVLELCITISGGKIDHTGLVLEYNAFETFGIPEQLVNIVVDDDSGMIALTADVFAFIDLVALITAVLVQRRDDLVQVCELFNRLSLRLSGG